ncbi:MAG: response regulator transcription factor [Crocinitomicaceae bacterium]
MNTLKILLAEDDLNLGFVIQDQLKMNGFTVHLATDGKEGLKKFNSDTYHLCVLDVMMPEKDGFSLAKDIRKINKDVPILFLTAKSQIEDKIEGFKVGGDDYLTKPFSAEELTLRIRALLKRANIEMEQDADIFEIGEYHFDSNNYQLTHPKFEKKLTKKEADILKLLCKNKNKVLPRDIVLNSVWGQDDYFVGRSLDVFITKLRKYLKEDPSISISNVHGVGFKLEIA